MVEYLPGMWESLGLIPSTAKQPPPKNKQTNNDAECCLEVEQDQNKEVLNIGRAK